MKHDILKTFQLLDRVLHSLNHNLHFLNLFSFLIKMCVDGTLFSGIAILSSIITTAEIFNPKTNKFENSNLSAIKNIIAKVKLSEEILYITNNRAYLLNTKENNLQQVKDKYDNLIELLKNKKYYQMDENRILIFENNRTTKK